jgi:hypothetical protein
MYCFIDKPPLFGYYKTICMYKCDADVVLGILFGHSYCLYIFDVLCLTIYDVFFSKYDDGMILRTCM